MSHMIDSGIIPQLEARYGPMFFFTTENEAVYHVDLFNDTLTRVEYPYDMRRSTESLKLFGIQQLEVEKDGVFFVVPPAGAADITILSTTRIMAIEAHEFV